MVGKAIAVRAGYGGFEGQVGGGFGWWPLSSYLPDSPAHGVVTPVACHVVEPAAEVYQDPRRPVHHPRVLWLNMGIAVHAIPASAALQARPPQHFVEASEDRSSHLMAISQLTNDISSSWFCPDSMAFKRSASKSGNHCCEPSNITTALAVVSVMSPLWCLRFPVRFNGKGLLDMCVLLLTPSEYNLQDRDVELPFFYCGERRALLLREQGCNLQELLVAYIQGLK